MKEQPDLVGSRYGHLFDHGPCGYHSTDDRGYFTVVNQTLLDWLGYTKDEVLGKMRFSDVVAENHLGLLGNSVALARGVELDLKRRDGTVFPVVLSVVSSGDHNAANGMLFSTVDNTRCSAALERIKTLDQELEAFSYSISHDLRAPLRSIDGYSKILQEDYAGKLDEEGQRVLGVIMNNARRMGNLIDDLLDFGRLGRKNLQYAWLNMGEMVRHVAGDLQRREAGRSIRFHFEELLPAFGDADMIRQVWFSLLENAVKFTGKKPAASVLIRSFPTDKEEVCYQVTDNGEGFDMKYASKLFGIFQRLHKIQEFAGTGVGLAIVKRIVSRHGGRVWADAALHEGATFYFTLPVKNENT